MNKLLKILIVEDDEEVAEYIKILLDSFLETEIIFSKNGKDAISLSFLDKPDLILMDIILEGDLDGITTAKNIKNNHDIPIIFMTSSDDEHFIEDAKITDPFGYMLKPIQQRELQAVITIALQQHNNKALLKHDTYITQSLKKIYHPLIITDINGKITSLNESASIMFGISENNIIGNNFNKLLNVKIHERTMIFEEELLKAKNNDGLYKEEDFVTLSLPNGGIIPISLTFSLVSNDLNENEGVCIMIVDLTQQTVEKNQLHKKQLEAAELLIRERILKEILDIGKDINQTLIYANAIEERLHTVVNRIVQFGNFKIAHIGLRKDNNYLHTVASSKNSLLYLNYPKDIPHSDQFLKRLYDCMNNKQIDLWEKREGIFPSLFNRRVENIPINSILILPLCSSKDETLGVLSIASSDANAFDIDIINYFEEFANDIAIAISLQRHRDEIESLKLQRENNYEETIFSFVQMIEERDIYTRGHSERVAKYSKAIAEEMGLNKDNCKMIYRASILHDIGKIQTPDKILLKPNSLNLKEYNLVQEHVNSGVRMLQHIQMYDEMHQIIEQHHEYYNGTGYPKGLKHEEISLSARIMNLADSYDAMTTNRIYRNRISKEEALDELVSKAGIQFDPKVVQVALKVLNNFDIPNIEPIRKDELESERMAYFFCDNLTNQYNEEYLRYYLENYKDELKNKKLYIYRISGLGEYNNKFDWCAGNKIISLVGNEILANIEKDNSISFRIHGNKFLIFADK